MTTTPRTASDILLALEAKVDQLTAMVHAQDLNLRILSNKLNILLEQMKQPAPAAVKPKENPYTVAADEGKMPDVLMNVRAAPVKISQHDRLPMQEAPQSQGIRRTSRTDAPVGRTQTPALGKFQIQDPSPPNMSQFKAQLQSKAQPESALTPPPVAETEEVSEFKAFENMPPAELNNKVTVIQRVTDPTGKSIFLAEVEIFDENNNQAFKTRTNGVGKWQASLGIGTYKVRISKRESVTKQKVENYQTISVDGKLSQITLDQLIIQ